MAYNGYLIKVIHTESVNTDYVIPMQYVTYDSYQMTYSVMDSSAKRNGKGVLIRKPLPHKVPHCSIQLRELNNVQLAEVFKGIQDRYISAIAKKVRLSVFIPEINDYKEDDFYIPDIEITIQHIEQRSNTIKYDAINLEFIGY